ncbi:MAG TPA: hypothetical protein VJ461_03240 [Candidatus Nanoarchaeia archaeon]|nr:hypothetical protein [Candidatus Nanoarchaeia archaeon]
MSFKKGQLSIETMIIYGLVILVALSVIGGLLYFNIIDLGSYLPDKCDVGGGGELKCEEMKFSSTATAAGCSAAGVLELGIRNIGQKPIESLAVSVTDNTGVHFQTTIPGTGYYGSSPISATASLAPGEIGRVPICVKDAGQTIKSGKLLRATIETSFKYKDGAIVQQSIGSIRVKAS